MVNKTIIDFDRLPPHFKQRLAMKFSLDKTLIDLPPNDGSATAIEICYCRRDYVIPLNDRALNILGWDAYLEKECEEEIESFLAIGSFNLFSEDLDDPFYS